MIITGSFFPRVFWSSTPKKTTWVQVGAFALIQSVPFAVFAKGREFRMSALEFAIPHFNRLSRSLEWNATLHGFLRVARLQFAPGGSIVIRNPAILLTILLVAISTSGQRQAPPSATPLALTNANIVNVRDGHVTSNATLVLRSGRIETVGQSVPPAG